MTWFLVLKNKVLKYVKIKFVFSFFVFQSIMFWRCVECVSVTFFGGGHQLWELLGSVPRYPKRRTAGTEAPAAAWCKLMNTKTGESKKIWCIIWWILINFEESLLWSNSTDLKPIVRSTTSFNMLVQGWFHLACWTDKQQLQPVFSHLLSSIGIWGKSSSKTQTSSWKLSKTTGSENWTT